MIVYDTNTRQALISGIAAIALLVVASLIGVILAFILPRSLVTHLLITLVLAILACIIWLCYHTYALTHTSYTLDRNSFVIRWGPIREVIPMGDVQRVIAASDIAADLKLARAPLPHWWIGNGWHPALGKIHFYSNAPLAQQLIIVTASLNYAISPADMAGFLEGFRMRFQMGPTQPVRPATLLPVFMTWPLWRDHVAHSLILIAIGLNALLFAIGFARYPTLPDQVVLHFDALGVADRVGTRDQVFSPAIISLELFMLNFMIALGVYWRGEKLAAYLAWGGSALTQLLFLIAMITVAFTA